MLLHKLGCVIKCRVVAVAVAVYVGLINQFKKETYGDTYLGGKKTVLTIFVHDNI